MSTTPGPLGRLYGVGVGPGDPELLTLKAHRLITSSPVVAVPRSIPGETGYAEAIVLQYLRPDRQEILPLEHPMSRDWESLRPYWERNVERIYQRLARGLDTVFVTEGDPFMYSTFIYLYELMKCLHPEVQIEVVPGVSSFLAAASRAGLPLATQQERIAIVADVSDAKEARRVLEEHDTVVFLKISSAFPAVYAALEELNLVDAARYVARATAPGLEEVVSDVRTLLGRKLEYLSLLLVRKGGHVG